MMPADIDSLARGILAPVGDAALRALALAGVIGLVFLVLRRTRAAVRLGAWTLVLYAALALPVLGLALPAWQWRVPTITVLQGWWQAPATPAATTVAQPLAVSAQQSADGSSAPARPAWSPISVAAAIYLVGVLVFSLHAGIAWLATRRLRRSARRIGDPDALARLARQASTAGMGAPPGLVESAELFVPVTMSVVQPVIVLPGDWRDWPAGKLDAVLAHEVAHVARRDALTQRVSLFYRAILWCSPLSWWLHRRLADLAEQASDEAALEAGIDSATYAGVLLDFFARLQHGPRRAEWHVAMARRADAGAAARVERILSWKGGPIMTRSKVKFIVAGIALVAVPVVVVTASIRLTPEVLPSVAVPATPVAAPAVAPEAPVELPPVAPRPKSDLMAVISPRKTTAVLDSVQQQTPPPTPRPTPAPAPTPAGSQTPDEDFAKGAYPLDTPGLLLPKSVRAFKPRYTPDAMRNKLQGSVEVEIIVLPDGTVGKARIKKSLDKVYGLDEAALEAALGWTFTPGSLNGEPVAVVLSLMLEFRLH